MERCSGSLTPGFHPALIPPSRRRLVGLISVQRIAQNPEQLVEPHNFNHRGESGNKYRSIIRITTRRPPAYLVPSRRELITSVAGILSMTAGCLGNEESTARCSSQGVGSGSQHLREIGPIKGDEQISLGISVSEQAVSNELYDTVRIRDSDNTLIASVPLTNNRGMSSLDPEDHSLFGSSSGELYAVPLGSPPVHAEYNVSLISSEDEQIATASVQFNCYADDGSLP